VTSRNQRASAIGFGLLALVVLPAPDGTIAAADRSQTAANYAVDYGPTAFRATQLTQGVAYVQPPSPLRHTQMVQVVGYTNVVALRATQVIRVLAVINPPPPPVRDPGCPVGMDPAPGSDTACAVTISPGAGGTGACRVSMTPSVS
jgi:hypothetical protein